MDGLDVLGAVEVGLVGGEDGEGAAHHSDGRHRRRAEPEAVLNLAPKLKSAGSSFGIFRESDSHAEVEGGHGPVGRGDALRDGVGQRGEERDRAQREEVERVAPADLVRYAGPGGKD